MFFHLLSGSYTQMCIHTDESYSPIPLCQIMHSFFWIVHFPFLICNNKIDSRHRHTQWLSYNPWLSSQCQETFFLSFFVIFLSAHSCRISIVIPRERISNLPLPRILTALYLLTRPFQIRNLSFNFNFQWLDLFCLRHFCFNLAWYLIETIFSFFLGSSVSVLVESLHRAFRMLPLV